MSSRGGEMAQLSMILAGSRLLLLNFKPEQRYSKCSNIYSISNTKERERDYVERKCEHQCQREQEYVRRAQHRLRHFAMTLKVRAAICSAMCRVLGILLLELTRLHHYELSGFRVMFRCRPSCARAQREPQLATPLLGRRCWR